LEAENVLKYFKCCKYFGCVTLGYLRRVAQYARPAAKGEVDDSPSSAAIKKFESRAWK